MNKACSVGRFTSMTPGRRMKLLRGQQRADVTATGTTGRCVATARRSATWV